MKVFAIILLVLTLAALAGAGYLYFTANLEVSFASCIAIDPVTQADYYRMLQTQLEQESFVGTRFSSEPLPSPEAALFYTWTVRVKNNTLLPARIVEIRITPMDGDILVLGDPEEHTLPAHQSMNLSVTGLTARSMHNVREATVTWYFWGLPFSRRLTVGQ